MVSYVLMIRFTYRYFLLCIRVPLVNLDHQDSLAALAPRVTWAALGPRVAKDCKDLAEKLANLVYPVRPAHLAPLAKTASLVIRVAKERPVLLALRDSPALVVLLACPEARELLVLRAIPENQAPPVLKENKA